MEIIKEDRTNCKNCGSAIYDGKCHYCGTEYSSTGTIVTHSIKSSKPFTFHQFEQIQWRHGVDVRIKYTPVGKDGLEIPYIYQLNSDGTAGKKYAAGTSAGAGTFRVFASARKITPPTDVKNGEWALVVYNALLC